MKPVWNENDHMDITLIGIGIMIIAVFLILIFFGCEDEDPCKTGDLRCSETILEICDSENNWVESVDCAAFDATDPMVCCKVAGIFTCDYSEYCDD